MDSIFTYRDEIEGKVGIGRLPNDLQSILDDISKEYYNIIHIFILYKYKYVCLNKRVLTTKKLL